MTLTNIHYSPIYAYHKMAYIQEFYFQTASLMQELNSLKFFDIPKWIGK